MCIRDRDPPATCALGARDLGSVQDGNDITTNAYRTYPAGDGDWFRFRMRDLTSFLYEGFIPGTTIQAIVRLSGVAAGEQLQFEIVEDSCSGGGSPTVVGPGQEGRIDGRVFCDDYTVDANGNIIAIDDSKNYFIHVFPVGDSFQCTSYTLRVEVNEEFFNGFCFGS